MSQGHGKPAVTSAGLSIPPPSTSISDSPDQFTAKSPDYTGEHAENRVLHINLSWFKYGTDDKAHASAIVLSLLLLLLTLVLAGIGAGAMYSGKDADWLKELFTWVGNAFLFTAGVAIGKGGRDKSD